ncbi:NADH dehydrogenase subunit C, partial [Fictibacillus macauensis ZFHKF-1]
QAKMAAKEETESGSTATPEEKALAVAKAKAAAAAKAKAAAQAKMAAKEEIESGGATTPEEKALAVAKAKAAAAAKAKAAAQAKMAAKEETESGGATTPEEKALAVAKAKAAAAAKAKAASREAGPPATPEEKAKAIAVAKAKAAAAAKAKGAGAEGSASLENTKPETPSIMQPHLDHYVQVVTSSLSTASIEDAYINALSKDVPTIVAHKSTYLAMAELLKQHDLLRFDYLSELHATDFETHFELYLHLYSHHYRRPVALKVKIDRDQAEIPSVTPLWRGADWPEREAFDLLGIIFHGHYNLKRIMMPDDWVGHPLRKDYDPYDVEV